MNHNQIIWAVFIVFLVVLLIKMVWSARLKFSSKKEDTQSRVENLTNYFGKANVDKNTQNFINTLKRELKYEPGPLTIVKIRTSYHSSRPRMRHRIEVATGLFPIDAKSVKIDIIYDSPVAPVYHLITGVPNEDFICDSKTIEVLIKKTQLIVNTWNIEEDEV